MLFFTAFFYILRVTLWTIVHHFGFDFWLFPAYREGWLPTNYLKPPFVSFEKKKDANAMGNSLV
jgi:hypothetical protein